MLATLTPVELTVEGLTEGEFRWVMAVPEVRDNIDLGSELRAALDQRGGGPVQLWIRDVDEIADATARSIGFEAYRDLWQLRCTLPNKPSGLLTRSFTIDDLEDFIAVNNRAFSWHPEQGGLTTRSVRRDDGRGLVRSRRLPTYFTTRAELVGFCWTKIHADHDPPLGEIYVIAIDPSRHGRRLGKPMTLAGLEWLSGQGSAARDALCRIRQRSPPMPPTSAIGFTRHHTDRAYRLDP